MTLSQFQALQESDKETSSLRELGLSDSEILLWKNRASASKVGMLCSRLNQVPLILWHSGRKFQSFVSSVVKNGHSLYPLPSAQHDPAFLLACFLWWDGQC